MSAAGCSNAAGTGHVRHADDFYVTPAWVTRAVLPYLLDPADTRCVLDPACGDGAILDAVKAYAYACPTNGIEIDPGRADTTFKRGHSVIVHDALTLNAWPEASVAVINPPFALAMEFVERAIAEVDTVAVLLRLAFMASQKRAAFHRAHPSDVYVLPRRPSFTPDGRTDSADYAWFVWGEGCRGRWRVLDVPATGGRS